MEKCMVCQCSTSELLICMRAVNVCEEMVTLLPLGGLLPIHKVIGCSTRIFHVFRLENI